jgi:hypothetical protein
VPVARLGRILARTTQCTIGPGHGGRYRERARGTLTLYRSGAPCCAIELDAARGIGKLPVEGAAPGVVSGLRAALALVARNNLKHRRRPELQRHAAEGYTCALILTGASFRRASDSGLQSRSGPANFKLSPPARAIGRRAGHSTLRWRPCPGSAGRGTGQPEAANGPAGRWQCERPGFGLRLLAMPPGPGPAAAAWRTPQPLADAASASGRPGVKTPARCKLPMTAAPGSQPSRRRTFSTKSTKQQNVGGALLPVTQPKVLSTHIGTRPGALRLAPIPPQDKRETQPG